MKLPSLFSGARVERRDNPFENPSMPLTSVGLLTMFGGTPTDSGVSVSEENAFSLATFWRCAMLLADLIAGFPLRVYEEGDKKPVYVPALSNPASGTAFEQWETLVLHLLVWGNAYMQKVRNGLGVIVDLIPIHPSRVTVVLVDGVKVFVIPGVDGHPRPWTDFEIMHIPGPSVDGIRGLGVVAMARQSLGVAMAGDRLAAAQFGNGSLLSGILTTDRVLKEEEARGIKQRWRDTMAGVNHAHDIAVMGAGTKFQALSMSNADSQFIQSRTWNALEICRWFGIPPHLAMLIDKSTSWGCLPGDAQVFTTAGPKPIVDVRVGEEVWSLGEQGMESAKVVGWQMTGYKPVLRFDTTGRTVRATSNHHMVVYRYFGRPDGRRKGESRWEKVHVDASEVRVGDYFAVPHGFGDGGRFVAPNGRPLTVGAMEFCGLYSGDGSRDGNRIEIAHEDDPDYMDHYRSVIAAEFGTRPYTDRNRLNRTRFSSTEAVDLLDTGFGGTALTKRVPGWVFRLTPELQLAYLRGYLDSDGCVVRGRIIYSSANVPLLEDVRHLCIQLGVPVGRVVFGRAGGEGFIRGRSHQSHPKYQLSLSSVPFNPRIGSHSPHKAAGFITERTSRKFRYDETWAPVGNQRYRMPAAPGCTFQRVTKISAAPIAVPVYDIEVEGTHTFVADGVIVGNSGIEQQNLGLLRFTVQPHTVRIEQRVTLEIVGPQSQYAEFDTSALLKGDTPTRFAAYQSAITTGWLTRNEVRARENLPPLDGLDVPLVPTVAPPAPYPGTVETVDPTAAADAAQDTDPLGVPV